ncbi:cytochrome P450 [Actinokineospora auranticolor]|uniref:Cytochrome P450 n=1 Tax=Actinokineospora auranticolor TaxID=155976 RepID=A0A2S6GIA8_9PSEU|nr:cytochrome P450 [Actinokineospora auranticolor]PPK64923.1 cytochrome P450 [Actinokineospora auranticolor]
MLPEIDLSDPAVLHDPFTVYGRAREQSPVVRLAIPGMSDLLAVTRHAPARAVLADPRFELNERSFLRPPGIPDSCLRYLRTMGEMNGAEHTRQRRVTAPGFSVRQADALRDRVQRIVDGFLADLSDPVDLVTDFAARLPMEVICELMGVDEESRPRWREYGAAISAGYGPAFINAIPEIIESARELISHKKANPADDVLSSLIAGELTDDELITLAWHLILAGQTPGNLISNAIEVLAAHPDRIGPGMVEEVLRFCGPQLLTVPRFAVGDVEVDGVVIPDGAAVTIAIGAASRDPRFFARPDEFDPARGGIGHLSFAHGPHFCLGASLARVQTEIALLSLFREFPGLKVGTGVRAPDGGTWRLSSLPAVIGDR